MDIPAADVDTVATMLASLVITEANPVGWGDIEVLTWPEAGIIAKPGSAGFVIIDRITGRQWVVEVKERQTEQP